MQTDSTRQRMDCSATWSRRTKTKPAWSNLTRWQGIPSARPHYSRTTRVLLAHHQHRQAGVLQHALRHAAHDELVQAAASM